MTDNEIIKALGDEIHLAEYVDSDYCSNVKLEIIKSALDLITRQQAENENLKVENQSLRSAANSLKMHYEEAQAEIERLKDEYEESKKRNQDLVYAFQSYKSEAYKEFAEWLKTEYAQGINWFGVKEHYFVNVEDIDNLVKEMVGDDNA